MTSQIQVLGATDNGGGSTYNYVFTNAPKNGSKLVLIIYDFHNDAHTMPTGWTLAASSYGGALGGAEVWWKDAGPQESGTYTITGTITQFISVIGYELVGAASGSSGINQVSINTSGTTSPSVTPSVLNCFAIAFWGISGTSPTWSSLTSGWTSQATTSSVNTGAASATKNALTSDTTTAINASYTPSTGTVPFNVTILIAPATQTNIYKVQAGAVAKATTTSNTSLITATATLGSAPVSSNVLIGKVTFHDWQGSAGTVGAPSGWTLYASKNVLDANGVEIGVLFYYKTGTTATSHAWTYQHTGGSGSAASILAEVSEWSGVNTTSPISGSVFTNGNVGTGVTTLTSGSISAQQNQVPIAVLSYDAAGAEPGAPLSFSTGWAQLGDASDGINTGAEFTTSSGPAQQSGTSVSVTYTYSSGKLVNTDCYAFGVILLTPAKQAVVVQTGTMVVVGNSTSGSKSISPTLPVAPNSANLVIALLGVIDHSATAPPSFGLPSGWNSGYSNSFKDSGNIQYQVALAWQTGVTATSYTFTYVFNAANVGVGGDFFGVLYEIAGAPTTSPIDTDGTTSGSSTSGSNANGSTLTAGASNELPMTWTLGGSGETSTMGVSATSPGYNNNAATAKAGAQFTSRFNAAIGGCPFNAGTMQANWTLTNADPYFIGSALIKALANTANIVTCTDTLGSITETLTRNSQAFTRTSTDNLGAITETLAKIQTFARTVSDTFAAISETLTKKNTFSRTTTDSLGGISETLTRSSQAFLRTGTDNISSPSDTPVKIQAFARTTSDSLGELSDTPTRLLTAPRTATDSLGGISESVSRSSQAFVRTATDSLGSITESLAKIQAFTRTLSDSLGAISDTPSQNVSLSRAATDNIGGISESVVRSPQTFSRTTTDSISSLSETLTRNPQAFIRSISESLSAISDSVARMVSMARTASDTLGTPSDTATKISAFSRSASDSLGSITDNLVKVQAFVRAISDTIGSPSDSPAVNVGLHISASDSLGVISEALGKIQAFQRTTSDTVGALNDSAQKIQSFPRTTTDSLGGISETLNRSPQAFLRTTSDSLNSISDSLIKIQAFLRTASDSLDAMSDSANWRNQQFFLTCVDTLGSISETLVKVQALSRSMTDTINGISESVNRSPQSFLRTAIDVISAISEVLAKKQALSRSTSDSLGGTSESVSKTQTFTRTISDGLSPISETAQKIQSFQRTASDVLGLLSDSAQRAPMVFARMATDSIGGMVDTALRAPMHFVRTAVESVSGITETLTLIKIIALLPIWLRGMLSGAVVAVRGKVSQLFGGAGKVSVEADVGGSISSSSPITLHGSVSEEADLQGP